MNIGAQLETHPANPATNLLPAGMTESSLVQAIRSSGYPLQTQVAQLLSNTMRVQHEWSYLDQQSGALRALDLVASKALWDEHKIHAVRSHLYPSLTLLVECKRSELPYVFFETHSPDFYPFRLPLVTGLPHDHITLHFEGRDLSTLTTPLSLAMSMFAHPFMTSSMPRSFSFARVHRAGSRIELSGEDVYNGVVLPIVKATAYVSKLHEPSGDALYFYPELVLPVCVIDAPMVVQSPDGTATMQPWVRVFRNETFEEATRINEHDWYMIDFVHSDYLAEYVSMADAFATEYCGRMLAHEPELLSGSGHVSTTIDDLPGDDIHSSLRPTH
jgi:hypothetical protein